MQKDIVHRTLSETTQQGQQPRQQRGQKPCFTNNNNTHAETDTGENKKLCLLVMFVNMFIDMFVLKVAFTFSQ